MARVGKKPVNSRRAVTHNPIRSVYSSPRAHTLGGDGVMSDLPLADAARYLGLSVAQTRRKVNAGELPSHRDSRGRIIVELGATALPSRPATDPTVRELVQLRVEVGLLREERQSFSERMEYTRKHVDDLVGHIQELTRQLAAKDDLIAELARRVKD